MAFSGPRRGAGVTRMLARLQQITTLGGLTLALLWAAWFAAHGEPVWAAGGALIIIFGYAAVLGLEFIFLRRVGRSDPTPPPSAAELLRAWLGEVITAPRVFCWHQPFRSTLVPVKWWRWSARLARANLRS